MASERAVSAYAGPVRRLADHRDVGRKCRDCNETIAPSQPVWAGRKNDGTPLVWHDDLVCMNYGAPEPPSLPTPTFSIELGNYKRVGTQAVVADALGQREGHWGIANPATPADLDDWSRELRTRVDASTRARNEADARRSGWDPYGDD